MKTAQLELLKSDDIACVQEVIMLLTTSDARELVKICEHYGETTKGRNKARTLAKSIAEYLPCL